eukprot:7255019-Pyramimonas_sp.AAC.1
MDRGVAARLVSVVLQTHAEAEALEPSVARCTSIHAPTHACASNTTKMSVGPSPHMTDARCRSTQHIS